MFDLKNVSESIRNATSDPKFLAYTRDANDDGPVELFIYDSIGDDWDGDGVSASGVVTFIEANKSREINMRMNSPGGLVFDALTIYNALASHKPKVTATIEGLAFSAASFIAMAADRIVMYEASTIGIHRASGGAIGNSKTLRAVAEWLDTVDEMLVDIYTARTGRDEGQVTTWLDGTDDGTLFSAKAALANGFADEVIPNKQRSVTDRLAAQKTEAFARMINERKLQLVR